MTDIDRRPPAIRAWAWENDIDCPAKGIVPGRVVAAFDEAHGIASPDPVDDSDTETTEPVLEAEGEFTVTVRLPWGDAERDQAIEEHLVEALWLTWHGGAQAERARILGIVATS